MKKIKPEDLKIGVELFQYSSKILRYIITGINELETNTHKERFYIAECQSCADHEKCVVAFKLDDYGSLVYSHMVNNYDYDEEYKAENGHYINGQYYWHKNKNYLFFLTRKDAQKYILEKDNTFYQEEIKKLTERIDDYNKKIESNNTQIEILNEK